MKPKHYYNDTYRVNFYLCIGWKQKDFERMMLKTFQYDKDCNGADGSTIAVEGPDGYIVIIWTRYKSDYPSLAHEVVHAANFVLGRAGVKPDFDNDEPQTYLVGAIMAQALRK